MKNVIPRIENGAKSVRYIYEGMTECGVKIHTVVEEWGEIVSSYP